AISDPAGPAYRRYLSAADFGARFGLPLADIAHVASWLSRQGFAVVNAPANRSYLELEGTVGQLTSTFGVGIADRTDAGGAAYHVAVGTPVVPAALRPFVRAVSGLDTSPASRPLPRFGPANGLHAADLAKAYGIDALHAQGLDGSGQSVAVVSFDTFDPRDISTFDQAVGISGPAVQSVRLPGAAKKPGDGEDEVSLDLETIRAIAPKAQIYDYEAPQSANWSDVINRIVEDGKVQIVSISWGRCEPYAEPSAGDPDDIALASAEMAGLSIFVSSGDNGAYDCLDEPDGLRHDLTVAADYPAVSPHVIAVGGTYLSLHQDGSYLGEVAWQDPLGQAGSGGGLSTVFARPGWQAGPGVANDQSSGKRQVPDVAGPADPASGMFVISDGEDEVVGGTSAATPFWAGSMVLAQELAAKDGAGKLGFLDPILYALAAAHQDGSLFHDISAGANLLYAATPGWDYATGWGSPRLDALVPAIVAYVQAHPH
ncbi:MAG TPA: S53 family peptidase, partial [Candidatus Limnocylindrales bacterium]|nr:S53 family peptidase [Candidatus Limnocylindrales bacterium]